MPLMAVALQHGYAKKSTPPNLTNVHGAAAASSGAGSSRRLRKRKCLQCGTTYTPKTRKSDARYCSDSCRQKAYYRRRHPAPSKRTKPALDLVAMTCAHCGRGELKAKNAHARYCSDSCRTMAARARRSAAALCLVALGMPSTVAADLIDAAGMTAITARLNAAGYVYSDPERAFVATGQEVPV
jgi:endogenous inhibitor of DNA gyrase (YacG/DUF329 family)